MANNQKLTPSTAKCYYSKLKACLNQALRIELFIQTHVIILQ